MTEDLIALKNILNSSIDAIVKTCEETGKPFPSLNEPIHPSEFSPNGIRNNPQVLDAIGLAVAAAYQLIATVRPPPTTLTASGFQWTLPAAIGVVVNTHVAEIIRPAGAKGLHIKDITDQNGADPKRLSRVLRFLATHHWFREVAPDVFAHNLLSSLLDTGKELKDITGPNRSNKHTNTIGLAAIAEYASDETLKAGAYLSETLTDPKTALSEEPEDCAFARVLGKRISIWNYYNTPEGDYSNRRFGFVMAGANQLQPPEAILTGYDWASVRKGGVIVDVGGGLGHVALQLAKLRPDLSVVVEDRASVCAEAKRYWEANLPEYVSAGKAHFTEVDFFKPQPSLPGPPDVFLLRQILHDWSDKYCIKLLSQLRAVAAPSTRLVVVDSLVEYACDVPNPATAHIPGTQTPQAPFPLLANLGYASALSYEVDLVVLSVLNSGERTVGGFDALFKAAGWKLLEVRRGPNKIWWPCIIAAPA